jgi:hypothetical protein
MLYRKNLFAWEQVLRVLAGASVSVAPWVFDLPFGWYWLAAGIGFALTGVFGFCPACYAVGRKTAGSFGNKPTV